jgi:hypothetical protein
MTRTRKRRKAPASRKRPAGALASEQWVTLYHNTDRRSFELIEKAGAILPSVADVMALAVTDPEVALALVEAEDAGAPAATEKCNDGIQAGSAHWPHG